jgi:nucleoside-diphosphate-sugar epimerase
MNILKNRVLITGAGGFIGGRFAEACYLSNNYEPIAGIRSWKGVANISRYPIPFTVVDIMDKQSIKTAFSEYTFDTIVHCAFGTNESITLGTRNLLDVALKHKNNLRRIIYLSSSEVYGSLEGNIHESAPIGNTGTEYGDLKAEAEKICQEYINKDLPIVIVRPSIVYGPYSDLWITRMVDRIKAGSLMNIKELTQGNCNLVYIDDLVNQIFSIIEKNGIDGEIFNANGNEIITWREYFELLSGLLNLYPQDNDSPQSYFASLKSFGMDKFKQFARWNLNHFNDLIMKYYNTSPLIKNIIKRAEVGMKSTPSADEIKLFQRNATYSMEKAISVLKLNPISIEKGLENGVMWMRHAYYKKY